MGAMGGLRGYLSAYDTMVALWGLMTRVGSQCMRLGTRGRSMHYERGLVLRALGVIFGILRHLCGRYGALRN